MRTSLDCTNSQKDSSFNPAVLPARSLDHKQLEMRLRWEGKQLGVQRKWENYAKDFVRALASNDGGLDFTLTELQKYMTVAGSWISYSPAPPVQDLELGIEIAKQRCWVMELRSHAANRCRRASSQRWGFEFPPDTRCFRPIRSAEWFLKHRDQFVKAFVARKIGELMKVETRYKRKNQ
jgi:hypothetical protein